jgi:hypothetical protein
MNRHGHNETLNFSGMSNYYGSIADGYGGFNWDDLDYLNQKGTDGSQWSESGFPNTPHSWAILPGVDGQYQYAWGVIVSTDLSETFSLKSMLAASAGQTNEHIPQILHLWHPGLRIESVGRDYAQPHGGKNRLCEARQWR